MTDVTQAVPWPPLAPAWHKAMQACWLAAVAAVTVLSLTPDVGPPGAYHLDKLIHATSYMVLALLPAAGFERRSAALTAALAMIALGCAIEVAQGFVPPREGDIWDALANTIGALTGAALGPRFRRFVRNVTARVTR